MSVDWWRIRPKERPTFILENSLLTASHATLGFPANIRQQADPSANNPIRKARTLPSLGSDMDKQVTAIFGR